MEQARSKSTTPFRPWFSNRINPNPLGTSENSGKARFIYNAKTVNICICLVGTKQTNTSKPYPLANPKRTPRPIDPGLISTHDTVEHNDQRLDGMQDDIDVNLIEQDTSAGNEAGAEASQPTGSKPVQMMRRRLAECETPTAQTELMSNVSSDQSPFSFSQLYLHCIHIYEYTTGTA